MRHPVKHRRNPDKTTGNWRLTLALVLIALCGLVLSARLFQLQVLEYRSYKVLASDQHEIQAALIPRRGTVFLKDRLDGTLYPIAQDRDAWQVYAVPKSLKENEAQTDATELSLVLQKPVEELLAKLSVVTSSYTILAKDVPLDQVDQLRQKRLPGIGIASGLGRLYPEAGIGGHFLGFVSANDNLLRTGKYGVEGFENDLLTGQVGSILAEKDAAGRRLAIGTIELNEAHDGADLVLTLDRVIQYKACEVISNAVKKFEAEGGSLIVMDPDTGAILAMCSAPDFDPANYGKIDHLSVLNNPATFFQYEPGSIFKPLTMAAGIDAGKVSPQTAYEDKGSEEIDDETIRNADKLAHGTRTMTQVLEQSLNTGAIFVQRQLGIPLFREYVTNFGFGQKTGIEVSAEAKGDISPLARKGQVFAATASFGQGISTTPIQMAAAFAALGNGGKLMKPYLISEVIQSDGTHVVTKPQVVRQVVGARASRLVSAMMVSVVEKGHGKLAKVPGYYVAGKTGTAQVAKTNGQGYLEDSYIGSFAGYAPADNPKFVMIVKIDKPKTVKLAEASAAPTWGEMAKFLLAYLEVPPERKIEATKPVVATSTPATASTSTSH